MDYQHYNDPSLIPFHTYNLASSSSSPTADLSNWNMMPTSHTHLDGEDSIQPERGIAGFVSKLYQCLQAPDDGHKYARWCRHNGIDMFIIDCIPKFTEIVLPQLFKHCKFASFVRQLNIYGFQRDTDARKSKDSKDKETCRWHHIHFRPGRRDLFHLIRRKTPRYSRRKRPRTEDEEDPETILTIGSGDESDTHHEDNDSAVHQGNGSLDERRRSASSASSSSFTLQQYVPPPSYHHTMSTTTTPTDNILFDQQQMYPPLFNNALTSPISVLEESNPIAYGQPSQQQQQQQLASTLSHLPLMTEQTMTHDEEQLKAQIIQLRKSYLRMYKILTGEVSKAFNLIDVQRSRIEFLEGSLRQQQQQMRIDTSSYQYNPILHTAPNTPVYHPSLSTPSTNQNFLFPAHNKDEPTNSPTTTMPDKWLSPYHQHAQIAGLSSMTTD